MRLFREKPFGEFGIILDQGGVIYFQTLRRFEIFVMPHWKRVFDNCQRKVVFMNLDI